MELILKQDVTNLGFKDDIVNVKPGYGRNFLIPQGKAVLATSSAKKVLAENLKQRAFKEAKVIKDAQDLAKKIGAVEMQIKSKVGTGDKLFGSVSSQDLEAAFEAQGHTVERNRITLPGRIIKRLGKYEATIRLHREVSIQFPFEIVADTQK
ncbi:MAG: 50S ribosomal protein L9 [Bacteroidetes bacterium]|nr:50S ribosomal protein L9 [Bacteroidota bacterium]